jgi:hypothetical protein
MEERRIPAVIAALRSVKRDMAGVMGMRDGWTGL